MHGLLADQIADPAEETLPYDGRVEFLGLGSPRKDLAKKSEALREDYIKAYGAHREGLKQLARGLGWTFTLHRTDEAPATALLPLHMRVSGADLVGLLATVTVDKMYLNGTYTISEPMTPVTHATAVAVIGPNWPSAAML